MHIQKITAGNKAYDFWKVDKGHTQAQVSRSGYYALPIGKPQDVQTKGFEGKEILTIFIYPRH